MLNRQYLARMRVLIVEQDWDYGIRLADWLASQGYQPVLVRTVDAAMGELIGARPHAIFVGLRSSEPGLQMSVSESLPLIHKIFPHVPVITIGDDIDDDLRQVVVGQGVSRILVKPVEFSQISHVLESELSAARRQGCQRLRTTPGDEVRREVIA